MSCFAFVVKEWAKSQKRPHFLQTLWTSVRNIFCFSLGTAEFCKKTAEQIFAKNFVWFRVNTCDVVCEEDLKHFLSSPLGNEDDAKELFNIKQEFLLHYLLQLMVASGFT